MQKQQRELRKGKENMDRFCQKLAASKISGFALIFALTLTLLSAANGQKKIAGNSKSANGKDLKTTSALSVPTHYIVGEGDLLRVSVWKESEISQNVSVRPDGMISLPLIGEIRVAGLSPEQIQEMVTEKLKTVLTNPQVTVNVLEVHSKEVYITGEVGKPGAYQELAPMNVLQLIARAGGLNEFAKRKAIYIFRASDPKTRIRFNYNEVVSGHRPEQNIILQPGDTVVVP
jgi:polysaccharide biosynthesis/export protein